MVIAAKLDRLFRSALDALKVVESLNRLRASRWHREFLVSPLADGPLSTRRRPSRLVLGTEGIRT
jgi:hypothetical protein